MSKQASPVYVFDFTIGCDDFVTTDLIKQVCSEYCKKWVFQKEQGSQTGHLHYQGRVSLKVKDRDTSISKKFRKFIGNDVQCHFSATNNSAKDQDFYVTKEDTRIEGPWKDDDEKETYIPRQLRELFTDPSFKWRPFQEVILGTFAGWDTRHVNILIDTKGNLGKSILKTTASVYKKAMIIPMINDYKDLMRMVMDMPKVGGYILDMPRAIKKKKLFQIYGALEHVKDGFAYDDRYNYKYEHFDCPIIWVFTNKTPDTSLMSLDRWKFWQVNDKYELVPFEIIGNGEEPTYASLT